MRQQEIIMIASGNHDSIQYLTTILANAGYLVLHAEKSEDAVSLVRNTPPDLILIETAGLQIQGDLFIPEFVGRQEPIGIPIMLLLANPDAEPDWESFGRSVADCIRIPCTMGELLARVRAQLELHQLRRRGQDQRVELADLQNQLEQEKNQCRLAEAGHKEAGDFYLKVLDDFPNPVWRANTSAKCDFFNKFWLEFTGRTMDQEMGDGWAEGVHPDDFERCLSIYLGHFEQRKAFEMEYRLKYHDGSYRWLLDCGNPFYTLDGEFGGYIGSCYDIQDRKNAERLLNAANAELEERIRELTESRHELLETKEYLEKLITFANAPIIVWDPSHQITQVNKAFEELTGIPPGEAIGEHVSLIFPEEFLKKPLLQNPDSSPLQWERVEIPVSHRSGAIRVVLWSFAPIVGPSEDHIATIAQGQDITEHIQAEKALKQLNRQLNLMSGITRHDILNQVNVIELLIGMLKTKSDLGVYLPKMEQIETVADNIRSEIEFTKTYEALGSQDPQWQDLRAIIIPDILPATVSFESQIFGVEIYADLLLKRVFDNLLDNSIRHGERVSRIAVSYRKSPAGLTLIWEDNGIGVPADEKESIFDRGHGKNTGLGLFFIREILLITGITIAETGEEGEGARFEMLVPSAGWRFVKSLHFGEKDKSSADR